VEPLGLMERPKRCHWTMQAQVELKLEMAQALVLEFVQAFQMNMASQYKLALRRIFRSS
jgi:hypothetical protein